MKKMKGAKKSVSAISEDKDHRRTQIHK